MLWIMINELGNGSISDSLSSDSGMHPANTQSNVGDSIHSGVVDENTEIETDTSNVRAFYSY